VTHLFNAMEPMSARQPGLAGAALSDSRIGVHVIADGLHVADEMLRLAFTAAKGRCTVVTDALAAARLADGTYSLGDVVVNVVNGVARRGDGTLAGGTTPLRHALRHLSRIGVDAVDALRAVTWVPAREMGRTEIASLQPGSPATVAIVDDSLSLTSLLVKVVDHELA
jgi:N-acetylglucosamine-6-phosphate deacetylase